MFDTFVQTIFGSWAVPTAFLGVLWGILGGALPGISPSIAMALLLPFTFGMDPTMAIILLASVHLLSINYLCPFIYCPFFVSIC
jgi:putative tricarboxylic transport membrane protein